MTINAEITCTAKSQKEIAGLPDTDQANLIYELLGYVTDRLPELGFDPSMVAQATYDLGHELLKRDGAPCRVIRIDPRRVKSA
jgi:hypothetical protein